MLSGNDTSSGPEGGARGDREPAAGAPPTISLPKGGGSIRGLGEKFSVNPATGTGSLSVPVFTSPARSGLSPKLSLSYDSGAGNGPFGIGWRMSAPSVTRKTDKGLPLYDDDAGSDVFILSDAEDLMPALANAAGEWLPEVRPPRTLGGASYNVNRYRPRVEGVFARIERWRRQTDGDTHWRVVTKDNTTSVYGRGAQSRVADPADPARVFQWLLETTFDDKGNAAFYEYTPEDATGLDPASASARNLLNGNAPFTNSYLKRIRYGNQTPYVPGEDLSLRKDWLFEVALDYGEHNPASPAPEPDPARVWSTRADPFSSFRPAFNVRTCLCQRVLMFHHFPAAAGSPPGYDGLVRSTGFTYDQKAPLPGPLGNPVGTQLLSVTQTGYAWDPTGAAYITKSFPPLEFTYSEAQIDPAVRTIDPGTLESAPAGLAGPGVQWIDLNGEGSPGLLSEQGGGFFYKRNSSPANTVFDPGAEGIAVERAVPRFEAVERIPAQPSLAPPGGRSQFMDLAGDGRQDMVRLQNPVRGYYRRTGDEGWDGFQPFAAFPNLDTRNPNLKFMDVDGDGLADILVSEDEVLSWHRGLGEDGFGPRQYVRKPFDEEKGPALVFADPTECMFLADMTGDGLTDIVRVRSGEVCYWPNLGYGRFGAKVSMDHAPGFDTPDLFDPRRVRLADIDGSGTADILYLRSDGVAVYLNQSGNSWADEQLLQDVPAIHPLALVSVVDLLGNGAPCLVWSSPLPSDAGRPMRYIDLTGGQKPRLLIGVTNNLGAETRVKYASSTKFYVRDRQAGTPWVTRLPFPVYVVERAEVFDFVGRTRLVTTYCYRHGYFDGVEREFRGFGYVERRDAESFGDSGSLFTEDTDAEADALHAPPVVTKTWFHNGAWPDVDTVIHLMARDYFGAPQPVGPQFGANWAAFLAALLPEASWPANVFLNDGSRVTYSLTGEERREAVRALKGSVLRQEIYAEDGSAAAAVPYSVSQRNYTVECLQPQGPNRYAVFFTHARETLDARLERNPADPRVTHHAVLEADPFGGVRQSVSVAYGRNLAGSGLALLAAAAPGAAPDLSQDPSAGAQPEQMAALLTLQENDFTNAIDLSDATDPAVAYRTPLPAETRIYQLTRPARADDSVVYSFEDLANLAGGAVEIAYETAPDPAKVQKRLIEDVRTLYRPDDLGVTAGDPGALLPPGQLQPLALPGENYKLALTAGLATGILMAGNSNPNKPTGAVLAALLAPEGGYVHSQGDANWWIPSGRVFYSAGPSDTPAQELAAATAHFFLPCRFLDPFQQTATAAYDGYDQLISQTRDPLGNTVSAQNDYRVLQPEEVVDPNGNHVQAAFDALGLVAGVAVMGKVAAPGGSESGDSLAAFTADLAQADIDNFIASPDPGALAAGLLGAATTRIIYDLDRFRETRQANPADPTQWKPVFAATLARETHMADTPAGQPGKVQVSFLYSDGLGREAQHKIQAEPGPLDLGAPGAPAVNPRWAGSGWVVLNNKGKTVRQYEPFFSATHDFEFASKTGVASTLFYDPLERVAATLHPNHTWEKVVFGPWRQTAWDVNDTVQLDPAADPDAGGFFSALPAADYLPTWYQLRTGPGAAAAFPDPAALASEQDAATKAAAHNDTPAAALFDALGRPFLSVAHNRGPVNGVTTDQFYASRSALDIQGNQMSVTDALGRLVARYDHDLTKNRLHQAGMEAGERWMLSNVAGKPTRLWDSRGYLRATAYDELLRPVSVTVTGNGSSNLLAAKTIYGDSKTGGPPAPGETNQRGRTYQSYDGAGVVTNLGLNPATNQSEGYDFKGNLLRSGRALLAGPTYRATPDWSQNPATGEVFTGSSRFDALNRVVQQAAPHSNAPGTKLHLVQHGYNEANLIETVDTWLGQAAEPAGLLDPATASLHAVTNIDYNAKGQRVLVEYGILDASQKSQVRAAYQYDPATFRLANLTTTRASDGVLLQDLLYYYDPAGNITRLQDDADIQNVVFFQNRRVEPSADYTYDAVYRLIKAVGREHLGQTGGTPNAPTPASYNDWPNLNLPHPNDGNAMGTYVENIAYDAAGNLQQLRHLGSSPANPGWTRAYAYDEPSLLEPARAGNRLTSTTIGASTDTYSAAGQGYDAHGNMLRMPQLQLMQWDFRDQLQATGRQAVTNQDADGVLHQGERTYYVYDAAGLRIAKATEAAGGTLLRQRLYFGDFEIYREYGTTGAATLERQTLHVMDDKRRVALIESLTLGNDGSPAQLVRFQFGNHLDSACLELGGQAEVISYEEYYPHGGTSYQAVSQAVKAAAKRYRYTGKERDEETGLNYHGARYYAPWLGLWTACDPTGIADGLNLYAYVSGNPVRLVDLKGTQGAAPPPAPPPSAPPVYQTQPVPLTYDSQGSQVGTDTGALAGAALKAGEKSAPVQALEKKVLDALEEQFKLHLKDNPVGTVVGVGLPALGLGGMVAAIALTNPKFDIPIVGLKSGRTLTAPLLSAGLEGLTGALTDDKVKLGVDYSEDSVGKPTYTGSVEFQLEPQKGEKGKLKVEASFGAHPSLKTGFTFPVHVGGLAIDIFGKVVIPTGPEDVPASPFKPDYKEVNPFLAGGAVDTLPQLGKTGVVGVQLRFGQGKKSTPRPAQRDSADQ